jgi:hypothetical protein
MITSKKPFNLEGSSTIRRHARHDKSNKIMFKTYLKIKKNHFNQIFMKNLLLVLLFLYQIHNN